MHNYIKKHKYLLWLFLILLAVAFISGYYSLQKPQPETILPVEKTIMVTSSQKKTTKEITKVATVIKLKANDYQLSPTSTVYDLMIKAVNNQEKPFSFKTKEFSGMGQFVEEINGIKNDPQTGKYWIYYINGESATVGISQYKVQANDIIEWKYETTL